MIRNLLVWAGAAALGLGGASAARAEPLKFDRIPADAKWIAHLDADAARSSKVIATVMKECLKPLDRDTISESSHTCPWLAGRFDKLRDVTLYGSRLGLRHGVAIVRGEWDKKVPQETPGEDGSENRHSWRAGSLHVDEVQGDRPGP